MLTLIALLGTSAFAATPALLCGTATAPVACDPANDVDKDGYFTNAIDAKMVDCMDDPAANWLASSIHPFAKPILGDDAATDSDCDATVNGGDEADELAAAEAAAKTGWSALEKSIGLCIESDRELDDGDFVWAYKKGTGYTCVFKKDAGYDGWSYDRESGVKDRSVVVESRRRIAGDARGLDAIGRPSVPEVKAVPATATTPEVKAVPGIPATGLYKELEDVRAQLATAKGDVKAALEEKEKAIDKKIATLVSDVDGLKWTVYGDEHDRTDGLVGRVDSVEESGPIFLVGGGVTVLGTRSLAEYEGGDQIRSGVIGGVNLALSIGTAWPGHILTFDIYAAQGITGGDDELTLPGSLASAGVAHQWLVNGTNIGIGPTGMLFVDAVSNPLNADVSGWGGLGGIKASYFLNTTDPRGRTELRTEVVAGVESYGTNDDYLVGGAGLFRFSVLGGRGPVW